MFSIVQIVHLDETGDSAYRMRWPAVSLAEKGPKLQVINVTSGAKERYLLGEHADLLILFNCADIDFLTVIERRKKKGLKTICEFNDNFYAPQPWSPVAKEWSSGRLRSVYQQFLRVADCVMVTCQSLRELLIPHTEAPIKIIENFLPDIPRFPLSDLLKMKVPRKFGWAGSLGHIVDILSFVPSIKNVLGADSEAVFSLMGNESLSTNVGIAERYEYVPWGSVESYFDFWSPISIGIVPLLDTPYNECRSDVKVIEMVSKGVLPLVPKATPYKDLIERFGLPTYNTIDDFEITLSALLKESIVQIQSRLAPIFEYVTTTRYEAFSTERLGLYCRSLPNEPSPKIPLIENQPRGYSVFIGSESSDDMYREQLTAVQGLLKQKKIPEALTTTQALVAASPHHAEYSSAYLNILINVNPALADIFATECVEDFFPDVRFFCSYITLGETAEIRRARWRELLDKLTGSSMDIRRGCYEWIKNTAIAQLKRDPMLTEFFEELLLLYPFAYALRLELAQAYEKQGAVREAKAHYGALRQASDMFRDGVNEIAAFDNGFLSAWHEVMIHRSSKRR